MDFTKYTEKQSPTSMLYFIVKFKIKWLLASCLIKVCSDTDLMSQFCLPQLSSHKNQADENPESEYVTKKLDLYFTKVSLDALKDKKRIDCIDCLMYTSDKTNK